MKKSIKILIVALAVVFSCACGVQRTDIPSTLPPDSTNKPMDTLSIVPQESNTSIVTPTALPQQSNQADPNAKTFAQLFPDVEFAQIIANLFDKSPSDVITIEELASYKGELDCYYGDLKDLTGIGYMTGITSFSCGKNEVTELPPEIGKLVNLTKLNLTKAYNLTKLPAEIKNLNKLEYLSVGLTSLEKIPPEIGELINLKYLYIVRTNITNIPPEIGKLKNLEYLEIHSNNISEIPTSICNLINLKELNISYTNLLKLPQDIGKLTVLERFDLFGCKLKTIPSSVKNMKNLIYFNVYNNFELDESYKNFVSKSAYECKNSS